MGWLDSLFGKPSKDTQTKETKNTWEMAPDYAESSGARSSIWDTLQNWQSQPGYGAIAPNWNDIWDQAKKRTSQYFWGSPTDSGLIGKLKADAARKGQTNQPAYVRNLSRLGKSEADMLSEMAVKQATQEAQFGEQGRQNWMGQMFQLAGMKPQMLDTGSTTTTTKSPESGGEGWNWLSNLSGLFGGGIKNAGSDFGLENLLPIGLEALGTSFGLPGVGTMVGNLGKAAINPQTGAVN